MIRFTHALRLTRKVTANIPRLSRGIQPQGGRGAAVCFSSETNGDDKKGGKAPEEFYDEEIEEDKEFMDMMSAVARGG